MAFVNGFRITVLLTFEHVSGLRFCPSCPQCNVGGSPCRDRFGSSATAEGGIFGRTDAVFTSIEAQKSTGSLHAHSRLFIQFLHQHTSVHDIISMLRKNCTHVVQDYFYYRTHVCRQVVHTDKVSLEQQLDKHETAWPDYRDSTFLVTIPEYLREPSGDALNLNDTDQLADNIVQGQNGLTLTFMKTSSKYNK